ncbi:putative S-acyltransferase [Trifolium pratense]|uniref:S-acyltransferase n=1 Tax=Trifolium pratense TaxID=57577 RepID=A0A2K3NNM9_TRIPR|nr:putative S-acyltransferase [Trifolium pratense]
MLKQSQPASSKNGSFIISIEGNQTGKNVAGSNGTYWSKLVAELYPPGSAVRTWTCSYCSVEQPPRAKHCHDCDKCILQFDHHCVWLGNCIGQGNHCQFWWYLCEETAVCIWTGFFYISHLKAHITSVCHTLMSVEDDSLTPITKVARCNHDTTLNHSGRLPYLSASPTAIS